MATPNPIAHAGGHIPGFNQTRSVGAEPVKTELEGTWLATDGIVSGEPAPQIIGQQLTFASTRFQITKEAVLLYGGDFRLSPGARPQAIDFDQTETDHLSGVWKGIYQCNGDTLTICDNAPDMTRPRPTGFHQSNDRGHVLVRFVRKD